jgi:putative transposase
VIRTHIIPCHLPRDKADALNLSSGQIYTGVLVAHWRVVRKKNTWLSEKAGTRWGDYRTDAPMHAHSVDAAQQGFYKACATTRALRKAGFKEAKFPHWTKRWRTTVWKNTAIKRQGNTLVLSNGQGNQKIEIAIPARLQDCLRFLEVRLVYDKRARKYTWHLVVENGKQPKPAPGNNVVSVDPGEIHPAVVGDEHSATVISCRKRRHAQQGHAKRLAKLQTALSRKKKGSRRHRRLVRAKTRLKAKHKRVMRDIEHKVSRAIVEEAVARGASTIAYGDIRDIADGVDCGKEHNQRTSQWAHSKVRQYVEYKAEAEGIVVALVPEPYTSQTCPTCQHRHKPRGRNFKCPACGIQAHRDVVGQINLLSRFKTGEVGKLRAPTTVKHRIPVNDRVMRRRQGTGRVDPTGSARSSFGNEREAAGF